MVKKILKITKKDPNIITGLIIKNFEPPELSTIINSLSFFILENVKKIDKLNIIGSINGIIDNNENNINCKRNVTGNPWFKDNSINWTLLLNEKIDNKSNNNNIELINSCFTIYISISFIERLQFYIILL